MRIVIVAGLLAVALAATGDVPLPTLRAQTWREVRRPVGIEAGFGLVQVPTFSFAPHVGPRFNLGAGVIYATPRSRWGFGVHGAQHEWGTRATSTRIEARSTYRLTRSAWSRWRADVGLALAVDLRWRAPPAVGPVGLVVVRRMMSRQVYAFAEARVAPIVTYTPGTDTRPATLGNPGGSGVRVGVGAWIGGRQPRGAG